ncbi:MAG: glycosyltransferase family 2 protein [Pseudomonadota bacterium]
MNRKLKEFVNHNVGVGPVFDTYDGDHVAILLAHYNGAEFLGEQLQSLSAQTHRDWSLILSDDGSSDGWLKVAADFTKSEQDKRIWLVNGPRLGFAQNFLSLVAMAGPSVPYAAFCDQDDVWYPKKLEVALDALRTVRPGKPALYCARTMVCDHRLRASGTSPTFVAPPSFKNAIVQNVGGGNTMVFNRQALDLLQDTLHHASSAVAHDWWAYQIISGAGGRVIFDQEPQVLYRQHSRNLIGSNGGWKPRAKRLSALLSGQFRRWNQANIACLRHSKHWLTTDAHQTLADFETMQNGTLFARAVALYRSGIYRQTLRGQAALWVAAILNKI